MSRRRFLFIIFAASIVSGTISFFSTMYFFQKNEVSAVETNETISHLPLMRMAQYDGLYEPQKYSEIENQIEEEAIAVNTVSKITPSTKMVYQYYYKEDDVIEEQEDVPPYFLLDLTFEDMQRLYDNWLIVSFSEKEVIMRKTMQGKSSQRYIVGQQDGYVAVFFEEAQNGMNLHEVTDTPVSSLSEEEQSRLQNGIFVTGDGELSKILEDYGS